MKNLRIVLSSRSNFSNTNRQTYFL